MAHAFERMQQPQGDDLTAPEAGFEMCGDGAQLLINLVEQDGDYTPRWSYGSPVRGRMSRLPAWMSRRTTASQKYHREFQSSSDKSASWFPLTQNLANRA